MLLAVDIGNSITTNGIFNSHGILENKFSFSTYSKRTKDELVVLYDSIFNIKKIDKKNINHTYISSVVPEIDHKYRAGINEFLKHEPVFINYKNKTSIKLDYINPEELGADRLCNSIAAFEKYGGPVLIIDLGTAIAYDLISDKYEFMGGIISPGIEISSWSLIEKTSKLFKTDLTFPESLISTTTKGNIQSGLFYGTLFEIEGIIKYIKENHYKNLKVVITGGFAGDFLARLNDLDLIYDENLTLEGINLIFKFNEREKK